MIECVDLTKDFGDFRAVDHVTLNVPAGSVLAVLGPNGAGKTTTVRMLTSILAPTSGWARIAGYDVTRHAAKVRASVGVLTEQHGLYERMRAIEYLDFFGRMYHIPSDVCQRRAYTLMERFGLTFALNKRLGEYSKGMKQKLALVRAMLHSPLVLLLDEPTSAMDPQSAKLVRDAIIELQRDESTFLITTHNLAEAQQLANTIAIIRSGRIVAQGTFQELVQKFVGDPVMEMRTVHPLNGFVDDLTPIVKVEESGEDWLRYRVTKPLEINPAVLRRASELGVEVVTLAPVPQSLETVYLQVMEEDEAQERGNVSSSR